MKRALWISLVFAAIAGALLALSFPGARAQSPVDSAQYTPVRPFNPYPPGVLPPDLATEIARVQREVRFIFDEALTEWRQLPPLTVTANPPTLQGSGYQVVEVLGKLLNFDSNMSASRDQACGFCHMPYTAFSGPIPSPRAATRFPASHPR